MAILAVVMLAPGAAVPSLPRFDWLDKLVHLVAFCGMTWFLLRSLESASRTPPRRAIAAISSLVYAILLEALQIAIPGRDWDIGDVIASALGIGLALLLRSIPKRG